MRVALTSRQRGLALAASLEAVYAQYDRPHVIDDPIECVRPFTDLRDREIAGFLAAGLAFGNVKAVMQSVRATLVAMGASPAEFVGNFSPSRAWMANCSTVTDNVHGLSFTRPTVTSRFSSAASHRASTCQT